ncbi:metallophosphoesterase [Brachyspira intermedia]
MKNLYILILSILILSCSNKANDQKVFTIVHMNDTHSKDKEFISVSKENGATNRYGGAARRKTFIDNVRKENENVIVMHAGDTITGSVFSIVYQGMDET